MQHRLHTCIIYSQLINCASLVSLHFDLFSLFDIITLSKSLISTVFKMPGFVSFEFGQILLHLSVHFVRTIIYFRDALGLYMNDVDLRQIFDNTKMSYCQRTYSLCCRHRKTKA